MSSIRTITGIATVLALLSPLVAPVAAITGPCDIDASGKTPCSYKVPLYQVSRASDGKTTDITPTSAGGVANSATQDRFCSRNTCQITVIYDQSGRSNHLTRAPPGSAASGPAVNGYDNLADATAAPVKLNGHKAYGVYISPGMGYRNDQTSGIATGDGAQGIYAALGGTHYNTGCCFDYGNAELENTDTGDGHMEALYFGQGNGSGNGIGGGNGPWIMADLENGLFTGADPKYNPANPSISSRFVTAILKGKANRWALRGGNSASGSLSTYYNGARPNKDGYNPMSKKGAIILGIGGDNSISGEGTFYEGVMTAGYLSDSTENQVQANIVAVKYTTA